MSIGIEGGAVTEHGNTTIDRERGRLCSLGYEGLTRATLIERFVQSRVTTLVDVRL